MGVGSSKNWCQHYATSADGSGGSQVERPVCDVSDFADDGQMKVFDLEGGESVLLVKENGVISALGPKCTHYGAPLVKGVLYKGKIRCPWHGACFDAKTGDIEDFPGIDCLPSYQTAVKDGKIWIKTGREMVKKRKRVYFKKTKQDSRTFVVIGGGGAGQVCIETLREKGFTGRLVFISKEIHLPYDRPKLSKALHIKASELYLRNKNTYQDAEIELSLEKEVKDVNVKDKAVICCDGTTYTYDKLFIATGGVPISMKVPGSDLENIYTLRSPEDGNNIAKNSEGKTVVVVGTSFIGMEVAAYLTGKAAEVHVIGRSEVPFQLAFGKDIGRRIRKLFEDGGIKFHVNTTVAKFVGESELKEVVLTNGEKIQASVCVIGIGVQPATKFLAGKGISMNQRGHLIVDEYMKTSVDNVYAGGDIVDFPLSILDGEHVNIGHWQISHVHGKCAALSMLGLDQELKTVPFFWCAFLGKNLRYSGYGAGFDDIVIDGDLQEMKFVAYYLKSGKVVAVLTANSDPVASQFACYIQNGGCIKKADLAKNPKAWLESMDSKA